MKTNLCCMKSAKLITLLIFFSIFDIIGLFAQVAGIENIQFYFNKPVNEVIITYDFVNFSEFERYDIELSFKDEDNHIIKPISVSGDVGKNITGGKNKKIKWDIFNDVSGISETALPSVVISSVGTIPIDPSMALIMNKIDASERNKFSFKFKRDGVMLIGAGAGLSALFLKIKGDKYIDQQKLTQTQDEYDIAGENAERCYTWSKISGGVSVVCVGVALYQYIWADKPGHKKQAFFVSPDLHNGVSVAWVRNF